MNTRKLNDHIFSVLIKLKNEKYSRIAQTSNGQVFVNCNIEEDNHCVAINENTGNIQFEFEYLDETRFFGKLDTDGKLLSTNKIKQTKKPIPSGICQVQEEGMVIIGSEETSDSRDVFIQLIMSDGTSSNHNISATEKYFDVLISPNPSTGLISINLSSEKKESFQISIINSLGQVIRQESTEASQQLINIDLSDLTSGTYFVQVNGSNYQQTQGVILR